MQTELTDENNVVDEQVIDYIIKQKTEGWVWHQTHLHGHSVLTVNLHCLIHWPECCCTPSVMLLAVYLSKYTILFLTWLSASTVTAVKTAKGVSLLFVPSWN